MHRPLSAIRRLERARDRDAIVIASLGPTVRGGALALAWRKATGRVLGSTRYHDIVAPIDRVEIVDPYTVKIHT